jgi:hypothetical protein
MQAKCRSCGRTLEGKRCVQCIRGKWTDILTVEREMIQYERKRIRRESIARDINAPKSVTIIELVKYECDWCGHKSARIPKCTRCVKHVCATCGMSRGLCMYCHAQVYGVTGRY